MKNKTNKPQKACDCMPPSKLSQRRKYEKWVDSNPDYFHHLPYSSDQLVFSSGDGEFFRESSNDPVVEGDPIGIEVDKGCSVDFKLFKDIYWSPSW